MRIPIKKHQLGSPRSARRARALGLCAILFYAGCGGGTTTPPEAGSGARPSGASAGACYNAYYPVTPGIRREYRTTYKTGGIAPSTHTETFTNISADSFTLRMQFPENAVAADYGWKCASDGLVAQQYANLTASGSTFKFNTLNSTGVTIPEAGRWRVGTKWDNSYEVSGQMTQTGGGVMGEAKGNISIASEIISQESVTVPAGAFDVFKVKSTITQDLNMKMAAAPTNVPVRNRFIATSWYAKDVGLVKSTFEDIATTEMVSFAK